MTQLEYAKKNKINPLIKKISHLEGLGAKELLCHLREGRIVIPLNKKHRITSPCGIGYKLRTKVNANIGTSTDRHRVNDEINKLETAISCGADTVMDLSVGGNLKEIRNAVLKYSSVPVGTVPIYEIAVEAQKRKGELLDFGIKDILKVIDAQAQDGVDFFTIHAGVTKSTLKYMDNKPRVMGIVSRGGAILAKWIKVQKKENPFYEYFDKILDIAYKYDITISLGDGLRPGSIFDASDMAQIAELRKLSELAVRARKRNVQVMIEGPGHVPINQIIKNVELQKKICHGAPFYILGPLVTDIAAGYDHINSAIGGALAASAGADFLCYVTPSEHLRLPSLEDVREGVIASKIAAHAADIAKNIKSALKRDKAMSNARRRRDWKKQINLSIDPVKARAYRLSSKPKNSRTCTMCGKYCSIKINEECFGM